MRPPNKYPPAQTSLSGIIVPGAQVLQAGGDVCGFAVVQGQVGIETVCVHLAAEQVPPLVVQVRVHAVPRAKNM